MQNTAKKATLPATALAALGVVFGDIGTSPLYALKESFHAAHGLGIQPENVLGILSIIFWCLMLIISAILSPLLFFFCKARLKSWQDSFF
ncbi:KUP/HAK/KT family potassium transporter [Klebsiella pneumoniae]